MTATIFALPWTIICANDIIEGVVSGRSDGTFGSPVPEPAGLLAIGVGFLALGLVRRRSA